MRSSEMSITIEKNNKTSTNKVHTASIENDQTPEKLDEEELKTKTDDDLIREEENNLSSEMSSSEEPNERLSRTKKSANINRGRPLINRNN